MKLGMTIRFGLAIAGVLLAGTALAQGPGGGMGAGPGFGQHRPPMERAFGAGGDQGRWWNNPKVVTELKLTDDQRKAMDGILLQHRETLIDLRANLEKAELTMEPLMKDDQPNEARILASIDKVAQARAELEKANARFLLALRGKLTPDQWKTLQADRAKRMEQGRGGREEGAEGRGGERPGAQGRGGWNRDGQGGPRQGGQYRRQGPPPPPAPGAPAAAPSAAPSSMLDQGADGPQAPAAE
jgi:Spy/CpxP family protein refolding chaperone